MQSYSNMNMNMVGQCPCGLFHPHNPSQCSSWPTTDHLYSHHPPSAVDCTLSLGTPSTRRPASATDVAHPCRSSAARISNFCWDFLQPAKHSPKPYRSPINTTPTPNICSSDPLLARRCANCDTTSTPLWRNGPKGPKSLCNACGIRFKKEERRATAAAASGGGILDSHVAGGYYNSSGSSSWAHHSAQKMQHHYLAPPAMGNDFRFPEHDFLSWRLNVTDRPTTLVHDFTR